LSHLTDFSLYRPVPKFLCVKGILFFSFWQSIGISILVAAHVATRLGPYKDAEHISVGLNDTLICLEMPFFAIAHNYAFSYKDFIDPGILFVARMPFYYAFRDAFGLRDVIEDSKTTFLGQGMDYREFEPAEGLMHQGIGREHRIRAGLRYSRGGERKYWLPKPTNGPPGRGERAVNRAIARVAGRDQTEEIHAPLLSEQASSVVHLAPDMRSGEEQHDIWESETDTVEDGYQLPFGDLDNAIEELYEHSKKYLFGDYNYPCIDVSSEKAREIIWSEEERVLRDERGAWFSPIRGGMRRDYGTVGISSHHTQNDSSTISNSYVINHERAVAEGSQGLHSGRGTMANSPCTSPTLSPDAVDLVVEDNKAAEKERTRERKKGEPAMRGLGPRRAYRRGFEAQLNGESIKGQGEVNADWSRMELGNQGLDRVQSRGGSSEPETWEPDNPEGVVARAQTPPAYVHTSQNNLPAYENPWA